MSPSPALTARNQRTGPPDRIAGLEPGPLRQAPPPTPLPDCLEDPQWLAAEYATKRASRRALRGWPRQWERAYKLLREDEVRRSLSETRQRRAHIPRRHVPVGRAGFTSSVTRAGAGSRAALTT